MLITISIQSNTKFFKFNKDTQTNFINNFPSNNFLPISINNFHLRFLLQNKYIIHKNTAFNMKQFHIRFTILNKYKTTRASSGECARRTGIYGRGVHLIQKRKPYSTTAGRRPPGIVESW